MPLSFAGFPDATSFADIEASLGLEPVTATVSPVVIAPLSLAEAQASAREQLGFGPGSFTSAGAQDAWHDRVRDLLNPVIIAPPPPPPPEPPPPDEPPDTFFGIPIPPIIRPFVPDLPDVEELIEAFLFGMRAALVGVIDDVDGIIDRAVSKILNPIDTLRSAFDVVTSTFSTGIANAITTVQTQADRVITRIGDKIGDAFEGVLRFIENITAGLIRTFETTLGVIETGISATIDVIGRVVGEALDSIIEITEQIITLVGDKITAAIEASATAIEATIGVPFAKLADLLPFQISELGETISDNLSTLKDLPELLGEKIKGVISELASSLGLDNLVHFTQILQAIFSVGDYHNQIRNEMPTLLDPTGGVHSNSDLVFIAGTAIPFLGSSISLSNPGIIERIRLDSMEHERPNVVSVPDGLELLRRFPEESDSVIADLRRGGWSDDRIDQLTRLRFQLTPLGDTLDGWRRGFLDDQALEDKMVDLGITTSDQALFKRLTFRIPPIQDQILFAIRGVFDVEESRAFGEFEGLPADLERIFIDSFDIESGDFSRQVEVFAREARKSGIAPEWVAAYWTSHWRLPSLQTAYEMFHRLQPDILEAESERVQADGFTVEELAFTKPELDRLVRAQDFSSFWRPKLTAIAFNPLTRVDIRRIAKLLDKDESWMIIQYRKVGFSPADAALMAEFTTAFNAEPDQDQAVEIRQLTKTVILDFVETSILTPEEGAARLRLIGYDEFAAEALVDLELAKVERGLQRDQIDLIEEQVKLQILDLNAASIELDAIGVPAAQKQVIVRKLGVQLAPRPASPSKSDLDNFLNQQIIDTTEYRVGLTERGFTDFWIDHYIALDRRLRTKKEMDTLFIGEILPIAEYIAGLVDLGYSETTIVQFVTLIEQAQAEAKEENG